MRTRLFSSTVLIVIALCLNVASLMYAQDLSAQGGGTDQWATLMAKEISMEAMDDCSLGSYVQQLREQNDGLNIVVDAGAANYKLPEMQFKNVSIRGVLKLIEQISGNVISVDIQSVSEGHDANIILIRNVRADQVEPPFVRVINVKQLIGEIPKEGLLEAFDEGYSLMDSSGAKPELRFHEPSGLLFFKGSNTQVSLAMEIVGQLEQGVMRQSQRNKFSEPLPAISPPQFKSHPNDR